MGIGKRMQILRENKGWTKVYVAQKLGFKNSSTYANWEYGIRQPDNESLQKLAEIYEVSSDYLLGISEVTSPSPLKNAIPVGEIVKIPIYGTIKAGPNGLAEKEHLGEETIETDSIKGGTYYYLKVTGDSMIGDGILPEDLALIREQSDIENGEIAAVIVNGDEATLKKVYKLDGAIMLQSSNPLYPPRMFAGQESTKVKIIGKLKEIKRKF